MQSAVLVSAVAILATIAYGDVRRRRIPNTLSLVIVTLGLIRIILIHDPVATTRTLLAGAVIFAAAFWLFSRGVIGGGDAKLVAAAALLIGYRDLFSFFILMSVLGGVLALATLVQDELAPWLRRLRQSSCVPQSEHQQHLAPGERSTVPYGLAIATAGIITLVIAR
ncbi:MAG: prepilin peptidase [Stellaceae bacterium]